MYPNRKASLAAAMVFAPPMVNSPVVSDDADVEREMNWFVVTDARGAVTSPTHLYDTLQAPIGMEIENDPGLYHVVATGDA
jgi:hypothetical protein